MHADIDTDRPSSSLLYRLTGGDETDGRVVPDSTNRGNRIVAPTSTRTTRRQHVKLMSVLRRQIEQDLMALFGTRRMSDDTDLSDWPLVQRSVLNYGVPDLSGMTGSSIDTRKLQRELVDAVKCYEPRLRPETLKISCKVLEHSIDGVLVEIDAMFGPANAMESFAMGLSICLGTGQVRRTDQRQAA